MKKRIICMLLAALLCLTVFSGCGKKTYTSSELMEMYGAEVIKYPKAQIWVTREDESVFLPGGYQNYDCDPQYQVEMQVQGSLTGSTEYLTKLQAEIMAGKGPDMILSTNPDLFPDINKTVAAGAFQSWDAIVSDWDADTVCLSALDGARSADGKLYILPLGFNLDAIITTKTNMRKYGLTEADFSDFYQTTDTLLRLWEQVDEKRLVHTLSPNFCRSIPELFDYGTQKTALMQPQIQGLLADWGTIFQNIQQRRAYISAVEYADPEMLFGGSRICEFVTLHEALVMKKRMSAEQQKEFVVIPLHDTQKNMTGSITAYALLSDHCQLMETIKDYMTRTVADKYSTSSFGPFQLSRLTMQWDMDAQQNMEYSMDYDDTLVELLDQPMRLHLERYDVFAFNQQIFKYVQSENPDWEDLEIDLNIYLSE